MEISQSDEQGLLTYTLNQLPSVRIQKEQMVECLGRDFETEITGEEYGIHFTQSNRMPKHRTWIKYKEFMERNIVI